MKRVLIVGISSFIGSGVARYLRSHYRIFGTYAKHRPRIDDVTSLRFPLGPEAPIEILVDLLKPDAVVYCAGQVDNQRCEKEPEEALYLNVEAPARFAHAGDVRGGRLIYLSTSKVFSGERGTYREDDVPRPIGAYAATKFRGEIELHRYENTFILRLGTIYGLGEAHQRSALVSRILRQLWSREPTAFIFDEYRSFLSVDEVGRAIGSVLDTSLEAAGTYHLSNGERDTYYTFACRIAHAFAKSHEHFKQIRGAEFTGAHALSGGRRGADLTLAGEQFRKTFSLDFESLDQSLAKLRQQLSEGNQ
jgi:dTDP-4-dehydrorhamnose reductase